MIALVHTLPDFLEILVRQPHHLAVLYALAIVALLLIAIPVIRHSVIAERQRRQEAAEALSSSILGLTPPEPAPEPEPVALRPVLVIPSKPVPAQEKATVTCTHCGVSMAPHTDFCPACGYAQPMRQSFTA